MLVNDIARRAGVSPHTVRYYERVGLLDAARDPDNRYRSFAISALTLYLLAGWLRPGYPECAQLSKRA